MITQNPDYFIAIAESGNLTKAAQRLYVSQPSLSQYLKRLEKNLGTELFDRSFSPMKLTYAGERYYEHLLRIKQMEQNIHEEIEGIKKEVRGRLKLGIALWRGAALIPDVLPAYHEMYPDVSLELHEGRFVELKRSLQSYETDLVIANLLPAGSYSEFEVEPIVKERILIAAPLSRPFISSQTDNPRGETGFPLISLNVLSRIPLALTKEGQSLTDMVLSTLAREHVDYELMMQTGNLTTAINLAAKGLCCTFVPEEGSRICSHPGELAFFEVADADLSWTLSFLLRKNDRPGSLRRSFMDCTKEILRSGMR